MFEQVITELFQAHDIPTIGERNYWFLRTDDGRLFETFLYRNSIAIGWNKINDLSTIVSRRNLKLQEQKKKLKEEVERKYPNEQRPGLTAGTIIKFVNAMSIGDIVVCPDSGSSNFIVGRIVSDANVEDTSFTDAFEPKFGDNYIKNRKVQWYTRRPIPRRDIDVGFREITNAHNTLSEANKYADYINRFLYPVYTSVDNRTHTTYQIAKEAAVSVESVMEFLSITKEFHKSECDRLDMEYDPNELSIRLSINSPGIIEFISENVPATIAVLGLFSVISTAIVGGTTRVKRTKEETEFEQKTDGLIEKMIQWQERVPKLKAVTGELKLEVGKKEVNLLDSDSDEASDKQD